MNWHRISLDDLFFFAQQAFNLIKVIYRVFLSFEGHILTFSKNASEILLHTFATYIQVIIKHNASFGIV